MSAVNIDVNFAWAVGLGQTLLKIACLSGPQVHQGRRALSRKDPNSAASPVPASHRRQHAQYNLSSTVHLFMSFSRLQTMCRMQCAESSFPCSPKLLRRKAVQAGVGGGAGLAAARRQLLHLGHVYARQAVRSGGMKRLGTPPHVQGNTQRPHNNSSSISVWGIVMQSCLRLSSSVTQPLAGCRSH